MQQLQIKDSSLQVLTEFERPVSEEQAGLSALADKMLTTFPYVLRPEDISIVSEPRPYGYRLMFRMFNGSADSTFTNKHIVSNFRDVKTSQALNLVAKSIDAIYSITVNRLISFNQLTFGVHAQFTSPEAYQTYMAQFVNVERGYTSGGKIVQAESRDFKGDIRLSIEKSVVFENGLYVNSQFYTKEPLANELSEKMAKRFAELIGYEELELIFPEVNAK